MSRFVWWVISNLTLAVLLYVCTSTGSPVAQFVIVSVAVLELLVSAVSLQDRVVDVLVRNSHLLPSKIQLTIECVFNAALIATFIVYGWWFTAAALMISTTINIIVLARAQTLSESRKDTLSWTQ
jgi:hypothetical protein